MTTDASGSFTLTTGLSGGAYDWRIKGVNSLANSGTTDFGFRTSDFGLTEPNPKSKIRNPKSIELGLLRAGDATDDNLVDVADFNLLKNSFGLSQGGTGYDDRVDFNRDGVVEVLDFSLLKGNFGQGGAPPLTPHPPLPQGDERSGGGEYR